MAPTTSWMSPRWDLGAVLVFDSVFSGLEFQANGARPRLEDVVAAPLDLVVLGGLSKEFAGGGLRFGYAYTRSPFLLAALKAAIIAPPHATLRYAAKKVLGSLVRKDVALLADLSEQRGVLRERADTLRILLTRCGWKVLPPAGGLFLVASPEGYVGKPFEIPRADGTVETVMLTARNIHEALFAAENTLINNDAWTALPGYCRFVLSTRQDVFEKGCKALEAFAARLSVS